MIRPLLALAFGVLLTSNASPTSAQELRRVGVSGFGGPLIAGSDLFDALAPDGSTLRFGHETGFAVGGRVTIWPTRRLGIEAEGLYVGADMEFRAAVPGFGAVDTTFSANAFLGSLSVLYAIFAPPLEPVSIYVSGGIGYVHRSSDLFDNLEADPDFGEVGGKSDIAGVVGIGIRYGVGRRLYLRGDFRDYLSSYALELGGLSLESKFQNDLLITGAIEVLLGP